MKQLNAPVGTGDRRANGIVAAMDRRGIGEISGGVITVIQPSARQGISINRQIVLRHRCDRERQDGGQDQRANILEQHARG